MNILKTVKETSLVLALMSLVTLWGCETTSNTPADQPFEVEKGMDANTLIEGVGEPDEVRPYAEGLEGVELWIYEREETDTKMVSTDMKEVPFVDPVTGHQGTTLENVMGAEMTVSTTQTIFLMVNGKVEAWKIETGDKSFL